MSARTRFAAVVAFALAPLTACSRTIAKPHLLHPGPAAYQRANAEQFDPYPQNDMGPKIVGGRPIDYLVPVPPETRARQYSDSHLAPALPILTPTVPGAPVYVPTAPPGTLPAYPAYPPSLPATPIPSQPPVEYRY